MKFGDRGGSVVFSSDGTKVVTASDLMARVWPVPRSVPDDPRWVTAYVEARSAWKADSDAVIHPITAIQMEEAWQEVLKSPAWLESRHRFDITDHKSPVSPGNVDRPTRAKTPTLPPPPMTQQLPRTARKLVSDGGKASWSPDGHQIVYSQMPYGSAVGVVNVDTLASIDSDQTGERPRLLAPRCKHDCVCPWSERRRRRDLDYGQGRKTSKPIVQGGWPVWAGDGKSLYFHSRKGGWKVFQVSIDRPSEPVAVGELYSAFCPAHHG